MQFVLVHYTSSMYTYIYNATVLAIMSSEQLLTVQENASFQV